MMSDDTVEYIGNGWRFAPNSLGVCMAWWRLLGLARPPSLQIDGAFTHAMLNNIVVIWQLGSRWSAAKEMFTALEGIQPDTKSPMSGVASDTRLHYARKVTGRLCLGTEHKVTHPEKDSGLSIAYEHMFRDARIHDRRTSKTNNKNMTSQE